MTTIATGPTDPGSPATRETIDAPVVERRQQRRVLCDAGPGGIEVLGAAVLRSPLDRDTAQPEVLA